MSTDSVLVTASAPTLEDLTIGGMQGVALGRIERYDVDGSWDDDPVVTVAGHLAGDDVPVVVQAGRPRHVRRANAADLSADLFVTAPDDGSGQLWLTDLSMVTPQEPAVAERHYLVLMALAAPVVTAHDGYLVLLSGGPSVVALDGVPEPEPLSLDDWPDRVEAIPPADVFVGGFLALGGEGPAGWQAALDAIGLLCERMPTAVPDQVLDAEEWHTLPATGTAPDWWPMQQSLVAGPGRFSWLVDGDDGTPGMPLVSVLGQGPSPDQPSPALGQGLVALAGSPLDYGYAHAWHVGEPWTGPVGPRMTGTGPYFMLAGRQLDQGLPNLYWLQVLGPRWVERIGRDRIASTPAHRVVEVAADRWLIQLTPSLADVTTDFGAFEVLRKAAVEHLGGEHFPFLD